MATHDYVIDNSTGANVRADINLVLQAILTNNSSSSAPSTTAAYMWWADTTNGVLKIRNSSNNDWVELLQLDGTLTLEDGSASTPALAFRDDLNTGIFSSAADTFNVATGGVERMELGAATVFNEDGADVDFRIEGDTDANLFHVDAGNDRIGIGTSSPTDLFHIQGNSSGAITAKIENAYNSDDDRFAILEIKSGICDIRFHDEADNLSGAITYDSGTNSMRFRTNGYSSAERMRIDSSGQLLVGATSATTSDGIITGIKAANTARMTVGISNTTASGVASFDMLPSNTVTGSRIECRATEDFSTVANRTADLGFFTRKDGTLAEKLTILSGGNVGIGTTSPASPLHLHESSSGSIEGLKVTNSTTGTGITDGLSIGLDSSENVFIFNYESTAIKFGTSDTERMRIDSSGNVLIGTTSFNNGNFTNSAHGVNIAGTAPLLLLHQSGNNKDFYLGNNGTNVYIYTQDSMPIVFGTAETERMRITSNGQIMHGCTDVTDSGSSVANNFAFSSDGNPTVVRSHSNMIYGATSNSADRHAMQLVQHRYNRYVMLSVHTNTGITAGHFLFYQGTNAVGSISTSDSATAFNTSSDYRLKENETVISDGITRLKTLIPRRFNWKIDDTNTPVDGFFAHEVTAVPEAITGTKDQVATADDVSNELKEGDPIYQQIDQSKLVPLITAALQEAVAKIEVLETKVAALEAA